LNNLQQTYLLTTVIQPKQINARAMTYKLAAACVIVAIVVVIAFIFKRKMNKKIVVSEKGIVSTGHS
jgi:glucose uptake protein GlcU